MPRFIVCTLIVCIIAVSSAFAQTGKISGSVIDRQTKEPLIGATVLIVGTTMGAATGIDGRYVILNVPPGTYSVKTTYVGYQDVTVTNVDVTAGLTKELNFELASTAVEVAPVTIVGERPLVEKSATNAIRITKAEDLERLPVRGVQSVVALQPGVVSVNDRIFIRGSRPDEVGYQIEGADVRNIIAGRISNADQNGGSFVTTIPEAIEEVLVQAGGYNAEFGGANAGIVSMNLKTGRDKYSIMAQAETDNLNTMGSNSFLHTYSYGYSDYVLSVGGPAISNDIRFFVTGENRFMRNYNPLFWSGANFGFLHDNGSRGGHVGDSANVQWQDGNLQTGGQNRYSVNGTLLFDLKPLLIRGSALYTWQRTRANGITADVYTPSILPITELFNTVRLPQNDQGNLLLSAKGTYFFNPTTFGELNLSFLDFRSKTYDPTVGDNILLNGDSVFAAQQGWQYENYATPPVPYDFFGFPFDRPGTPLASINKVHHNYVSGSANITSQIGRHELKAGASYEYWTNRTYQIGAGADATLFDAMRAQPDVARDPTALPKLIRSETFLNNYGYDEFGNEISSGIDGPKHPKFAAFYLQDKVEFSDLIINAGLRADYLDMNTWKVNDPNNPGLDRTNYTIVADSLHPGDTFWYVEPRLGFSFPVTDRTIFHLQYGQFIQAPPLYTAYRGRAAAANIYIGQFYIANPLALDIQPTRTTQYEIGFTQQFTDFASFDITGFYKDLKGELQQDVFVVNPRTSTVQNYHYYTNSDFATTKGLEFRLTVRRIERLQAQLNYTLSDARGTNSFAGSAAAAVEVTQGQVKPTDVTPLLYDQTHRGSVNLDYRFGTNDGGPVFSQLGVNFLFTFASGHRFTLATGGGGQQGPETGALLNDADARSRVPLQPINQSTTPWTFNLDLRVDKTIPLGGTNFNVYAYVQNLLNTQNVINVYYRTGNAYDDGYLSNPALSGKQVASLGPEYVALYQAINLQDRQHQWNLNGFDLFGTPRQVRVGVRLEM